MKHRTLKLLTLGLLFLCGTTTFVSSQEHQKPANGEPIRVPRAWDDEALASMDVPLIDSAVSLKHATSSDYYGIPVRRILKTYPVYAPGNEPPGYMEALKQKEPEEVFDPSKLKTKEDWIRAGELIFDSPITINSHSSVADMKDPAWFQKVGVPLTKEGIMPFYRYVVLKKGVVQMGEFACAMCHTRVLPDGTLIKGAQGNFPLDRALAYSFRARRYNVDHLRMLGRILFAAPWTKPDLHAQINQMSAEDILSAHEAIPPGVMTRFGTSLFYPPQVPDLVGLKDRRYLDHTGLVRHRSIEDLMRYSAINQGGDVLDQFGNFSPLPGKPDLKTLARYSDEQLYALALYLYSLTPPPNPNKFDALAARGKRVFEREGCAACHTPPLYTNNKLTLAEGFKPPEEHFKKYDILPVSVGTDPNLALTTRRGTGYYKVPSLRGLWYRGPFEHNGSVAALEDWFDPRRTHDDYVPTGFKGPNLKTRAVKGHLFGLNLSTQDRKALIAFLKTL